MQSHNYLKSVSRDSDAPSPKTRGNKETIRGRIEQISHQAADLTAQLEGLVLLGLPASLPTVQEGVDFYAEVRRFEISLIRSVMKHTRGSQTKAARLLKLNTTTLNSKIKSHNICWWD